MRRTAGKEVSIDTENLYDSASRPDADGIGMEGRTSMTQEAEGPRGPGRGPALDARVVQELWARTYNTEGRPDWSHILPYYDDAIHFKDSIQEIRGIKEFRAMTERLAKRSKDLKMRIVGVVERDKVIFLEWEMTIRYKKNPSSILYGCSRLTLHEDRRIIEQRDYYDLWGDIFDNIPRFGKAYRKFMIRKFG
jgi:limonene-1,2-epoxide hydrolase